MIAGIIQENAGCRTSREFMRGSSCLVGDNPIDAKGKLAAEDGAPVDDAKAYRSLAGPLQYLTITRPDLAFAVQQACLHMHAHRGPHLALLKMILRYVRGTSTMGLCLRASPKLADWAGCPETRVSRSSAEAEYRAMANAAAECMWLCQLLGELHCGVNKATVAYCDNVSAVYMSANPVHHKRTKHIELDIHYVRERVQVGDLRILHVPTGEQYADVMTKGLPTSTFASLQIQSVRRTDEDEWLTKHQTAGGVENQSV